jgi:DNA-binding response OmpR family regulator
MTQRPHILVVEDDPLVCEVLSSALDESYATTQVGTSRAAFECLVGGGIDLILLDCTLPDGMDRRLVPRADQCGVPVILMSGDPARVEQLSDQPRPFVVKPFSIAALLSSIEDIMTARAV